MVGEEHEGSLSIWRLLGPSEEEEEEEEEAWCRLGWGGAGEEDGTEARYEILRMWL